MAKKDENLDIFAICTTIFRQLFHLIDIRSYEIENFPYFKGSFPVLLRSWEIGRLTTPFVGVSTQIKLLANTHVGKMFSHSATKIIVDTYSDKTIAADIFSLVQFKFKITIIKVASPQDIFKPIFFHSYVHISHSSLGNYFRLHPYKTIIALLQKNTTSNCIIVFQMGNCIRWYFFWLTIVCVSKYDLPLP